MPNRILFLVSAVLASLASSLALPILPNVAHAADDCLTSPAKATSPGGHWRYHLERSTGRKCWYLTGATTTDEAAKADTDADADGRNVDTTATVPPKPTAKIAPSLEAAAASPPARHHAAKPAPTPSAPAMLGPANNARAEFIDTPRDALPVPAQPDANGQQGSAQQGSLAARWPSPGSAPAVDGNTPAATNAAQVLSAQPAAELQPAADQPAQAAPEDQAPTTNQPADSAEGPDYLLYALIIFTTAFASVVGFAGLRFLLEWWRDWREESQWRQSEQTYAGYRERSMTAMDEVPMDDTPADDAPMNDAPMSWASTQRPLTPEPSPPRIEEEIDRIEQLLALTRESVPETQPSMFAVHAPRVAAE